MNRGAVITGGTAGIGFAIATRLLESGYNVFICSRSFSSTGVGVVNDLKAKFKGQRVGGTRCDVAVRCEVVEMFALAKTVLGSINLVVNNAGYGFSKPFPLITEDEWRESIATNLTGVFNCSQVGMPYLLESSHSDIVNIGSRAGRYAFAGGVAYNTTKFGLQGLSEALFLDMSSYGVRVSLIAPGPVSTGFAGQTKEGWQLEAFDVADAVVAAVTLREGANMNWIEMRPVIKRRL